MRCFSIRTLLILFCLSFAVSSAFATPRLADARYTITLFAEDPEIVTPIGGAVDSDGRLYVVESHTLNPPEGYAGPKSDRIKLFTDEDKDGKADKVSIFAEGLKLAVRLARDTDGSLLACSAGALVRLEDTDNDGRADQRSELLRFESEDPFMAGLWAVTVSPEGKVYAATTLTTFPYRIVGSDGTILSDYGNGGVVVRCEPDGTGLESYATGFWAPPALRFDRKGRLFMVDNDPISRGPNRIIHCLEGGDYGYRARYGLGGDSPFVALKGELPGTVPAFSTVHEAPSGLLVCANTRFPRDFRDSLLIPTWGANTIERHDVSQSGSTLKTSASVWVRGDSSFKPTALTADLVGNIYVSDWIRNDFVNHGHGRIWRIAPKPGVELDRPRLAKRSEALPHPRFVRTIRAGLRGTDPEARHAAIVALAQPERAADLRWIFKSHDADLRLGALAAFRRIDSLSPDQAAEILQSALTDSDGRVRAAAAVWIADEQRTPLLKDLQDSLKTSNVDLPLAQTFLAAMAALDKGYVDAIGRQMPNAAEVLPTTLPDAILEPVLTAANVSPAAAAFALRWLDAPLRPGIRELLRQTAITRPSPLNLRALEILADTVSASDTDWFLARVRDTTQAPDFRSTALAALGRHADAALLLPFVDDPEPGVQVEAVIALGQAISRDSTAKQSVLKRLGSLTDHANSRLRAEIQFLTASPSASRPSTLEEWNSQLELGGDPEAGRRRFFFSAAACNSCHSVHGRGKTIAPALDFIERSQDRATIIRSILRPSEYFGPEFQLQEIETTDKETYSGILVGLKADGTKTLMMATGETQELPPKRVAHWRALQSSLMPDGLEACWSVESLRDVVEFLAEEK